MNDAGEPPDLPALRVRPKKVPTAFRTISEVADDLHIPQHVLRFWETKFPQVRPLKRGGGRRYYRPDDIALLRRISDLLYTQGFTIKGVQRLLREGGGRLSDDIPPPTGDERQEAPSGELLLPGLLPPSATDKPELGKPGPGEPPATGNGTYAGASEMAALEAEVARLRQALAQTLDGLTALRALLP